MIQEEGQYYLYRHIRLDRNEVFYVGIGTKAEQYRPYRRAYSKKGRNDIWSRIIAKTNYEVEILLESDSLEFIKLKEKEFINLYGFRYAENKKGTLCNLTFGGELNIFTDTTRIKMKKSKQNMSEETKRKMSESARKKILTKEHKERISLALSKRVHTEEEKLKRRTSNTGKKRTEEFREKLSLQRKGKSIIKKKIDLDFLENIKNSYVPPAILRKSCKKIAVYSLENEYIMTFSSIGEASRMLNIQKGNIIKVLKGINFQSFCLIFKYEN